jgi:pimeloyl-ACP methyl ester carboxylesterase
MCPQQRAGIHGEFVRVLTEDGMELNGLYVEPSQKAKAKSQEPKVADPGHRTAVVHVHGWDGNFYENRFIDHAAHVCSRMGIGFVSGNNRGHDYIADVLRSQRNQKSETRNQKPELGKRQADRCDYVQLGGMYERLADSVADIRAWVDFAVGRGAKRVILQGHSHGAIKVAHYLTTTCDPRVGGLILLSPSDDMGIGRRDLGNKLFERLLDTAHALMHAGMGRQLLPVKELKYPVSAATFFDCHNKDSMTGIFNMSRTDRKEFPELASVSVPVLMAVGTVEEAFIGAPQKYVADVEAHLVNCPSFTGAVIEGAPHNYLGSEAQLAGVLKKWLRLRIRWVTESRIRGRA